MCFNPSLPDPEEAMPIMQRKIVVPSWALHNFHEAQGLLLNAVDGLDGFNQICNSIHDKYEEINPRLSNQRRISKGRRSSVRIVRASLNDAVCIDPTLGGLEKTGNQKKMLRWCISFVILGEPRETAEEVFVVRQRCATGSGMTDRQQEDNAVIELRNGLSRSLFGVAYTDDVRKVVRRIDDIDDTLPYNTRSSLSCVSHICMRWKLLCVCISF